MAKNQVEKQNLPWEARLFDQARDMKVGKQIKIDSWELTFFSDTLFIQTDSKWWNLKTNANIENLYIYPWDSIRIQDSSDDTYILFSHFNENKSSQYLVSKEVFANVLNWKSIKIIKPRKAPKVEKVEEDTKNQVEKLTRPSIEEYKEWSIYKVIKEWYLLPGRTRNNKYEERSFLLEEGDILKINEVWDFFWRSIKSKNEKLFITILREWKKWKIEDFDVIITSKDFINYTKWWLKPLKDTQKVQDKVAFLLEQSSIIPWIIYSEDWKPKEVRIKKRAREEDK
jgi:hypothetical protein